MSGSAIALNWAKQNANAVLQAWYPGEEGGTAIAQTLDGTNNPSGRLPITLYTGVDQLPEFTDYSMARRTYRYFDGEPLFPFGFGLGYSTFAYSDLKLEATLAAGDPLRVEAQVRNAGTREGDEVVQVYLTFPKLPGAPLTSAARLRARPPEARRAAGGRLHPERPRPEPREPRRHARREQRPLRDRRRRRAAGHGRTGGHGNLRDSGRADAAPVKRTGCVE